MKRLIKRIAALGMVLVLALALTACGKEGLTAMDATAYIKGLMDETYLGVFDEGYLKLTQSDEKTCQQTYENGLAAESDYFAQYFSIDNLTEEARAKVIAFYKTVYSNAKYVVQPATKLEPGTFAVKVLIQPMDIIQKAVEGFEAFSDGFLEQYEDVNPETMTDEEYDAWMGAYAAAYADGVIQLCNDKLAELEYLEEVSIVVQVQEDKETGLYTISDSDFANLDAKIIAYE